MEFKHPKYYKELKRLSGLNKKSKNTNASNTNGTNTITTNPNIDTTTPTTQKKKQSE
jgi:hypothetical protein